MGGGALGGRGGGNVRVLHVAADDEIDHLLPPLNISSPYRTAHNAEHS